MFLVAAPIVYRAPPPLCYTCLGQPNQVPDDYASVTRYYFGIGGEDIQGHYTMYWSENLGIQIT